MNELKTRMIRKAEKRHKKIFPCAQKSQFEECFTNNSDFVFFWYNTEDHSTHVITESLRKKVRKAIGA
ncbi:MAG: hypothetical protein JXA18_15590 [Chitinispirillaceae bacterium]|nr:hypothetical protein [Chitinispirillaceae bacterium]